MTSFSTFAWRITAAHMISYFLAGLFAYYFLDYKSLFETPPFSCFMKPMNSPVVTAGPSLQFIRAFIFAIVLWPFRAAFLQVRYGWLKLWGLLVGLCILSTTAAAPGSVEGFLYTTIPVRKQVVGYAEVVPQTLLFSLMVYYWNKRPRRAWNMLAAILVCIIVLLSVLALTVARVP